MSADAAWAWTLGIVFGLPMAFYAIGVILEKPHSLKDPNDADRS